jgi:FG-GAP-like repeat
MRFRALALFASCLLVFACSAQAQFLTLPQYQNGTDVSFFQHADVNNDGNADIVGVPTGANGSPEASITVLLGTSTGGFGAPITTAISGVSIAVDAVPQFVLGDFNGDNKIDVAVFGTDHTTGQNAVAVMLGNGNGTFQAGIETILGATGLSPTALNCSINAADFNGDGKLDLAYLHGTNVSVALGKGNGTFGTPIVTSISGSECLASGDFNNDDKTDLAVAQDNGLDFILLGKGNGTFETAYGIGKGGSYLVTGKMDGADLDLIGVFPGTTGTSTITVMLGNGTGKFPTVNSYNAATGVNVNNPLVIRDLNGDHAADIAYAGFVDGTDTEVVGVLLNNGNGTFTVGNQYVGDGQGANGFLAVDISGTIGLAVANVKGGISVLPGKGNGTFKANLATSDVFGTPIVGEFGSNTKPDLLLTSSTAVTLLSNGNGTFTVVDSGCGFGSAVGDFTGNGKLDLAGVTSVSDTPVIGVCLGNGNGTFTPTGEYYDTGVQHRFLLAGKFTNDGNVDLAASDENGFSILLGNGNGSFQNGIPTAVNEGSGTFILGDFNNDGKLDLATISGDLTQISVFLGKGNGEFSAPVVTACACANGPDMFAVADLNGDGNLDLVVTVGGNALVFLGKGNGSFQAPVKYALGQTAMSAAAIADYNGDGKLDIAVGVTTFSAGSPRPEGAVSVLFGDGTGKFSAPTLFPAGGPILANEGGLATADFNGDGKPDLALSISGVVVTFLNQE